MSEQKIIRGTIVSSHREHIKDGAVVVLGDQIRDVGTFEQMQQQYDGQILGSPSSIVLPGFVNTHSHAVQTLFRGAADDRELLPWLNEVILPGEGTLTSKELFASTELGYAEMLMSGITSTNDMLTAKHSIQGFKAAEKSGIRARIGKMLMDRNVPDTLLEDTEEALNEAISLAEHYPVGGRLQYSFTPRFIIASSDKLMRESARAASERGLMFHTHAAENINEGKFVKDLTGHSYIHAMHALQTLGPHSILAHCVHTSDQERDLLHSTNTRISHNPSSNSKLASGIAPIPDYLDRGMVVGLATDGSPATGVHDFFLEMKLATFLQKAMHKNPKIMPAKTVFELATLGGAKAMNLENVGLLEKGFKADITILNPTHPSSFPMYDPLSYIVYTATPRDVETVMVDGQLVVDKKELQYSIDQSIAIAKQYAEERPFETRI